MIDDQHNNDDVPALNLDAVLEQKAQQVQNVPAASAATPSTDGGNDTTGEEGPNDLLGAEDPVYDPLYTNPIIEQIMRPYGELNELLHVAHGDQATIGDLINGINEGQADSSETEMFREMVRLRGGESAMQWLAATQQSINHMAYKNGLTDTVLRSNSRWLQGILINDQVVGGHRPKTEQKVKHKKGERLTGVDAMIRVRQEMGIGDYITLPAPHSGLWVTMLVSGEDEMVNFHTRVLNSKSVLGRRTAGLVFSNSDVVVLRHLWELLSNMIQTTSLGHANKKELVNLIKIQDIPLLVAGYMAARFRSGYMLAQPCQVDPLKCGDIAIHRVNINHMTIIDNNRLTEAQKGHMRKRGGHTPESVLAYQEYFSAISNNVRNLSDSVRIVLGSPSVDNKLTAGDAWIDAIEDAVTLSFKDTLTREERVTYINKQAAVAALRNYSHWVKRIDFLDTDGSIYGFIEGEEDIYKQLTELSKDEVLKEKFFKEINAFINETTIGIVALPRYTCQACKQRQPAVNGQFPDFTPVNLERAFFTLLTNTLNSSITSADI